MSNDRSLNCCLCGAPRRPTQAPVESFGFHDLISIKDHRPLREGRWEGSPQLIVDVSMYRNGGIASEALHGHATHICDDCIVVGLKVAKAFVDSALRGLGADGENVKRPTPQSQAGG